MVHKEKKLPICPHCKGEKTVEGKECPKCHGTGIFDATKPKADFVILNEDDGYCD